MGNSPGNSAPSGTHAASAADGGRRRGEAGRRGIIVRRAIGAVVVLAALAVVADFTVAAYSEYRVSRSLRAGAQLSADPEVTIHGFPFLVQAVRGTYRTVDIRARAVRPDIPGEIVVEATLSRAHVPPGDLADVHLRSVPVDEVEGRMRIEPVELGRLFRIPDLSVSLKPADKDQTDDGSAGAANSDGSDAAGNSADSPTSTTSKLILTGTILTGIEPRTTQRVSVQADLLLDGDQVRIIATDLYKEKEKDSATTTISTPVIEGPLLDKSVVLSRFTRTIDTRDLPFGVHPNKVKTEYGGIVVEGKGEDMTIDMDRFARP
ncbi:LmeA family phospholipid-binding protein [Nocardia sp. alder85J]|uniref:LmeA family phospholipid-binding protein n=1 Tax=Nocardia sp. alder85J TaxID=2862949 RepID=UPI0021069D35